MSSQVPTRNKHGHDKFFRHRLLAATREQVSSYVDSLDKEADQISALPEGGTLVLVDGSARGLGAIEGLRKLGIDPKEIRYVIISHAHAASRAAL